MMTGQEMPKRPVVELSREISPVKESLGVWIPRIVKCSMYRCCHVRRLGRVRMQFMLVKSQKLRRRILPVRLDREMVSYVLTQGEDGSSGAWRGGVICSTTTILARRDKIA